MEGSRGIHGHLYMDSCTVYRCRYVAAEREREREREREGERRRMEEGGR